MGHCSRGRNFLFLLCSLFLALITSAPLASAQGSTGNTATTPIPGVPHDYIVGVNEVVNPGNGALSVRIAQPAPPERGKNWPKYAFIYDSNRQFVLTPYWVTTQDGNGTLTSLNLTFGLPSVQTPPPGVGGGTTTTLSRCVQYNQLSCNNYICVVTSGYTFTDPDGGVHGLGLQYGVSDTQNTSNDCLYQFNVSNYMVGGDEQYKAIINPTTLALDIVDSHGNNPLVEDTNGNYLNSTGRTAPRPAPYTVQNKTVPFNVTLNAIPNPNIGAACRMTTITGSGSFSSAQSVTLPNGEKYQFTYDGTLGLLNQITYPTGATVTYTWNIISDAEGVQYEAPVSGSLGGLCSLQHDWFAITKRVVKYDGATPAEEQDFVYGTNFPTTSSYEWTTKTTTVTTKDLIRGTSFSTVYAYLPYAPIPESETPWEDVGVVPQENTITYKDTSGNVLKTTTKAWAWDNQMIAQCETLPNGLIAGTFYIFQPYSQFSSTNTLSPSATTTNLPTDVSEYDYGSVSTACVKPSSGIPIRETVTTYASFGNTPLLPGYPSILDRPATVQVYGNVNGTKTLLQETDYAYDGATPTYVSLTSSMHDETNYGSGLTTPRGNPTTITKKCFTGATSCTNSVTAYTYDSSGQVLTAKDADLNTTTYYYADSYTTDDGTPPSSTNAYVTKITKPTTNGVPHISKFQYGFEDGKLRSVTDENSLVTTYCYWTNGCSGSTFDPFVRLAGTKAPDGGATTVTYNDAGPSPSVTASATRDSAGDTVTNISVYDAIGHEVQTELSTDPSGPTYTATSYDGIGKIYKAWNPTRCSPPTTNCGEPTWGFTTYLYDALGRTTQVTNPDNTTVVTTYTNRATQVQDEGNGGTQPVTRISQSDALGHLNSLCEVAPGPFVGSGGTSSSSLIGQNGSPADCGQDISGQGFLTTYTYDAFGNLLQANQGSMAARTFSYDSLSRLVCASNPENSSAACPTTASSTYIPGTTGYAYDANGNLLTKTSPLPNQTGTTTVTATYGYDALNRMLSKTYSDGKTPTANFTYDAYSGRTLTNAIGRLVKSSGGPGIATYTEYDPMGRVSEQWQYTPLGGNNSYSLPYTYDYLGNMVTASDGYFHTYTYAYNNASRLTGLTTSTTPTTLLSGVVYTPAGKISSDTLGTSEVETYTYTNKNQLQAENTKLSATQTYAYSLTFAPDGDVTASTDSINGNWTYIYDPFNRLVGSNQNSGAAIYSYVYDRFGNRWQQNGPHTMIEAFTGNSSVNNNRMDGYAYDAAGNLLSDGTNFYTFDAENRIVEVQEGSASGPVLATYAYDADGRRVHRTGVTSDTCDTTRERDYVYNLAGSWVLEVNSNGTACKYEIYAGARHFVTSAGGTYFDHSDWLGTMRLRNTYATPLSSWETCTSLPFGDALSCPNGDQSTIHFTGKERDSESGLDNFGTRYNSSSMGRFMSPDPSNAGASLDTPQSWNAYSYVLNNPLNYIDPSGMDCIHINNDTGKYEGFESGDCDNSTEEKANTGYYIDGTVNTIYTSTGDDQGVVGGYSGTNDDSGTPTLISGTFATPPPADTSDTLNPFATAVFADVFKRLRWLDPDVCGGGGFVFAGGQVKVPGTNLHGELLGVVNYDSKSGTSAGGIGEVHVAGPIHVGGEVAYNFRSHKVSGEGLGFMGHETASAKLGAFGGGLLASSHGDVGAYGFVGPVGGGGYATFVPGGTPCKH